MRHAPSYASLFFAVLLLSSLAGGPTAASAANDPELVDLTGPQPRSQQMVVSIQRFELPENIQTATGLAPALSAKVGVAGTNLAGVRVKIQMPDGIEFERLEARLADGLFLQRDGSFLRSVGRLLMGVARLLLFGRLVASTSEFEVSSNAWALLLGVGSAEDDVVSLQTTARVQVDSDDERSSNHGAFVVCRLVVAANSFSELIDVYVVGRSRKDGQQVRYHFPRLVLPGDAPGEQVESDAWNLTERLVSPRQAEGS